jgi:hypothetical protein
MDVPLGQMTTCQNFNCLYGNLMPRPAWAQMTTDFTDTDNVWGLTQYVDAANFNHNQTIFAVSDAGTLFSTPWIYNQGTPATATDVTGTATIAPAAMYQFDILNNVLCGFGGSATTGIPFQITAYNGTASNLSGSPPKGDVVKVCNNMMFVGRQLNSPTTFSTLSWSNFSDPQTWPAGNSLTFRKGDGDRIQALGAIGSDLYIFKFNSIGRLSTQTNVIAGAVALGPLTTLYTNIGAACPFAVDNLPDGRIVFLGSNYHVYIFDGFTLTDISDRPLPLPNVQSSIWSLPANAPFQTYLKVYPTHNQIVIGTVSSSDVFFAYDFAEDFWAQWTGTGTPQIVTTVPVYDNVGPNYSVGYFGLPYSLIGGVGQFGLFQMDNNTVLYGPGNTALAVQACTCTINVPLTGDYYNFIPRSLLLPMGDGSTTWTAGTNFLKITFGYDGTLLTSPSFTSTTGVTYPNVLIVPIPQTREGATTVRPLSLQIKIDIAASNTSKQLIFHPFYLSDELLN